MTDWGTFTTKTESSFIVKYFCSLTSTYCRQKKLFLMSQSEFMLIFFLTLLGLFLSVLLLYFNVKESKPTVYLSAFYFLISLYLLTESVLLYSKSVFAISLIYIHPAFLSYLTGPVFFWYVRSVLTDNPRLRKGDSWHLLPSAIFFVTSIPYYLIPFSHKLEIADEILKDPDLIGTLQPTPLYDLAGVSAILLSRPLMILGYAIFSCILIYRYISKRKSIWVLSGQKFMVKWLLVLTIFLLTFIFCHVLTLIESINLQDTRLFYTINILQSLSGFGLAGLLISPFFFPRILYGLPIFSHPSVVPAHIEPAKGSLNQENEKNTMRFESDYLQSIALQMETCMKEKRPYLDPFCNLGYLSGILQIPAHHLAYYFREVKQQSFTDYRNEWRITHARSLMEEGKAKKLTIDAIGRLSGFSSRNTFFTAFKKIEGITPGLFLDQIPD